MIRLAIILSFIIFQSCSKPKTVMICGDHVCINKKEAKQYFEENLTLEVQIIEGNKSKQINLVELNLKNEPKREINIVKKDKTDKTIKPLSNYEIKKIKEKIKEKKQERRFAKKNNKKKLKNKLKVTSPNNSNNKNDNLLIKKDSEKLVDVCTFLDKCSIEEISKYLINQGKKKKFPDITRRE